MNKGFLLMDKSMNTVIVPMDDEDLIEWMKYKINLAKVHKHKTLKELDADVRAYMRDKYEEEDK
jgi:hypothetical protein